MASNMTPQKIFDTVATHLFTQGVQAQDKKADMYLYRGPKHRGKTTTCAIGCLITDKNYRSSMDNLEEPMGIKCLLKNYDHLPQFFFDNSELLWELQGVHDTPWNWRATTHMRVRLKRVAITHDLDDSIVDTLRFGNR